MISRKLSIRSKYGNMLKRAEARIGESTRSWVLEVVVSNLASDGWKDAYKPSSGFSGIVHLVAIGGQHDKFGRKCMCTMRGRKLHKNGSLSWEGRREAVWR
jgi:hypothetical protein